MGWFESVRKRFTLIQKLAGLTLLYELGSEAWSLMRPIIDTLGRIDLVWQFHAFLLLGLGALYRWAASPLGRIGIIVIGLLLIYFGDNKRKIDRSTQSLEVSDSDSSPSGDTLYKIAVISGPPPQIFVANIRADFGNYSRDAFVRFRVSVVTCEQGCTLNRFVAGHISYRFTSAGSRGATALTSAMDSRVAVFLPQPVIEAVAPLGSLTIRKSNAASFPLGRGVSTIILAQHLSPSESAQITTTLVPNRGVEFDFTELTLTVTSSRGEERLPLWDGVFCSVGDIGSMRVKIEKGKARMGQLLDDLILSKPDV